MWKLILSHALEAADVALPSIAAVLLALVLAMRCAS